MNLTMYEPNIYINNNKFISIVDNCQRSSITAEKFSKSTKSSKK